MNVLLLCTHLNPGGLSRYIVNLSSGLKKEGCNVFVANSGGSWQEKLEKSNVSFVRIPINTKFILSLKVFRSFFKLIPVVKSQKIDILHANTRVTQVLAFFLSALCRIPYISTFHGFYRVHLVRKLFKFEGRQTISVSNAVKNHKK